MDVAVAQREGGGGAPAAGTGVDWAEVQQRKTRDYLHILAQSRHAVPKDFWEVVVVTAADDDQRQFYERQLDERRKLGSIPDHIKYLVIADPPGEKIGCGGSTMHVIHLLEELYGPHLYQLKVLIIHAGGYSKRLPNHSATGKIFASVPCALEQNGPGCSMLELKFVMFIDFPRNMSPGIFISCADDIELFESRGSNFTHMGFTAMSHPAEAEIGLTHGVFVLERNLSGEIASKAFSSDASIPVLACRRFLHKPSMELMQSAGALLSSDQIMVDSNFFFDTNVTKALLQYYRKVKPLLCEIDAYGDFMQPLGSEADESYLSNNKNVSVVTDSLATVRKELYQLLKGTQLNVIPFIPSLFIHIGTCQEYLDHFCINLPKLGFSRHVFNAGLPSERTRDECSTLHCIFGRDVDVQDMSVVEFCRFPRTSSVIGSHCILNDLEADEEMTVNIPANILMQTLPIALPECMSKGEAKQGWITSFFGISDDFKKTVTPEQAGHSLHIRGVSLEEAASRIGVQSLALWPAHEQRCSVWNARLFPVATTPQESLRLSLNVISSICQAGGVLDVNLASVQWLSWEEALKFKDMPALMSKRACHIEAIRGLRA